LFQKVERGGAEQEIETVSTCSPARVIDESAEDREKTGCTMYFVENGRRKGSGLRETGFPNASSFPGRKFVLDGSLCSWLPRMFSIRLGVY
jgi:hypothetical protein